MLDSNDEKLMALAIEQARLAAADGEVPVGAIAVIDGTVIAVAHNRPIALDDPTAHAEMLALREAGRKLHRYRLSGLTMYVTIEPCVMCIGGLVNARVSRIVFGARDDKTGAAGSVYDIGRDGRLNHTIEIAGGLLADECAAVMREFFRDRRK